MDTQQAYERIRAHFSAFGAQLAKTADGQCMYRTSDTGDACAVGCLIPDEKYTPEIEGTSVCGAWLAKNPFIDGLLFGVDKQFLRSAQTLHDSVAKDVNAFVMGLDVLALAFGLDVGRDAWRVTFDPNPHGEVG